MPKQPEEAGFRLFGHKTKIFLLVSMMAPNTQQIDQFQRKLS